MIFYSSTLITCLAGYSILGCFCGSVGANPSASPRFLPREIDKLHIERNYVPKHVAQTLYRRILEAAVPGPHDSFHPGLLGIRGDAGTQKGQPMSPEDLVTEFRQIVWGSASNESAARASGILRVEHLMPDDYHRVEYVIHETVQNNVLKDAGTIHLYVSRPNSAALGNHTDITDIFVLQLDGAKEWLLCQEQQREITLSTNVRDKLDKCVTYKEIEIGDLMCETHTLFPGDALYLPKRVVHSARATRDSLSVHLTFGLAAGDGMCPSFAAQDMTTMARNLQQSTTCTSAEGGSSCDGSCDDDCDFSCDHSCDASCDCICTLGICSGCCDDSCDSSCDSSCDDSCDTSCDVCPDGAPDDSTSAPDPESPTCDSLQFSAFCQSSFGQNAVATCLLEHAAT